MSTSDWTTVRVRGAGNVSATIFALFALGAEGVQELDDELMTHLRHPDERRVAAAIRDADPIAVVEYAPTPDVDWSAEWRTRITAHRLGRLIVTPPWLADEYPVADRVVIDPGMAFGTGEHETTRGVVRLMQRFVRAGDVVADVGAGSGVLSIAAAKLGAARVAAIELDPDAIGNAEDNVRRNNVAGCVSVIQGDAAAILPLLAPIRLVFANILSSVIVPLLPLMRPALAPDGVALLSGILLEERAQMLDALRSGGWVVLAEDQEGQWWSVAARP